MIFSHVLYQLSYPGTGAASRGGQRGESKHPAALPVKGPGFPAADPYYISTAPSATSSSILATTVSSSNGL